MEAQRENLPFWKLASNERVPQVLATFSQALVDLSAVLCKEECLTVVEKKCCGQLQQQLAKLSTLPVRKLDQEKQQQLCFQLMEFGQCYNPKVGGAV